MKRERSSVEKLFPLVLDSAEVLERWVAREGDRYVSLLVERGFIRAEDRENPVIVQAATKEWRKTYVSDLSFETRTWNREQIRDLAQVFSWRLGGWKGWLPYRPQGKLFTTFGDVIEVFDAHKEGLPEQHRTLIPTIANAITGTLETKDLFLFRSGGELAALDGTHTLVGLAYALKHGSPIPDELNMYVAELGVDERDVFDRFCVARPVVYGSYS